MSSRSHQLFENATRLIPGGVNSPVRSFKHVGTEPIYFTRGEGPYLFDVDGRRYIDFCLSFGPLILGHSAPQVVEALTTQAKSATSFGACHPAEVEMASLILKAYPGLDQVRLVNSGTEAVMTAIRLARGWTSRTKIIKFEGGYHGHSDGLLAQAGSGVAALTESSSRGVPESVVKDTLVARLDDLSSLSRLFESHKGQIAAVVLEPVPANYGLWIPEKAQLEEICRLARAAGALVLFDEVISGFRVALGGAVERYGLVPDLVTLGKVIGGGLPLAAVVGRREIMQKLAPVGDVYQAGTLSGNPLATAAGIAVIKTLMDRPPYETLAARTARFASELERKLTSAGVPARVISSASLFWIELHPGPKTFPPVISAESHRAFASLFKFALERGVYLAPSPYEVGFLSTAHTDAVIDAALESLDGWKG